MTWIMRLYALTLNLYPSSFRKRFASEMVEVFISGVEEANKQGALWGYILGELLRLPAGLVNVYMWSMRAGESQPVTVSSMGMGDSSNIRPPSGGWRGSILAGLPHLLIGILIVGSEIIGSVKNNYIGLRVILLTIISIIVLGVFFYSIRNGWKLWTASWIPYMVLFAIAIISLALDGLLPLIKDTDAWIDNFPILIMPLLLAYLLYKIACRDRMRGLLAAIPAMVIIWIYFMESVPSLQKSLAWGWIFLLAFTASALILRTKRFLPALGAAMIVPILGGIPFVYLGVYQGGTLPFSEPGPSLLEVSRQFFPFLMMAFAIVAGPQLAARIRAIGHESVRGGGKLYYRLILGGALLGIVYSLLRLVTMTSGFTIQASVSRPLLAAAIVLFLSGYIMLLYAVNRSKPPSADNSGILQLAGLFFPLIFVPIVIFLVFQNPVSSFPNNLLLATAELIWVVATIIVIKD